MCAKKPHRSAFFSVAACNTSHLQQVLHKGDIHDAQWSNPERMPSSRLSLRLGQLPHAVLAELAALLCSDSPSLQATAEECIAAHNPLPQEMVERVLLSPDLLPPVLGPLDTDDGAAAAVCSQWLAGWKATNEAPWPRRRLKQLPLDLPEELAQSFGQLGGFGYCLTMASTPDGRLLVRAGSVLRILDRSMRVLQTVPGECLSWLTAATDDSIFFSTESTLCTAPLTIAQSSRSTSLMVQTLNPHRSLHSHLAAFSFACCTAMRTRSSLWMRRRCSFDIASG